MNNLGDIIFPFTIKINEKTLEYVFSYGRSKIRLRIANHYYYIDLFYQVFLNGFYCEKSTNYKSLNEAVLVVRYYMHNIIKPKNYYWENKPPIIYRSGHEFKLGPGLY